MDPKAKRLNLNSLLLEKHYCIISHFYEGKSAKRSKVPYMVHIDEGLSLLSNIEASEYAKAAYCIHPIFQGDDAVALAYINDMHTIVDPGVLLLAMEYRKMTMAYANDSSTDHFSLEDLPHKILPEVIDMLIADKVQNYKDFLIYHDGKHARSKQLVRYFNMWFRHLNIKYRDYKDLL